ncbi:MAG: hypothetical protein ACRDQV_00345 [Pseudonocardiaceae bacterium]
MKASEDETRHGKPVAKLVPIDDEPPPARGSIAFHGEPVQQKLPNQSTACGHVEYFSTRGRRVMIA